MVNEDGHTFLQAGVAAGTITANMEVSVYATPRPMAKVLATTTRWLVRATHRLTLTLWEEHTLVVPASDLSQQLNTIRTFFQYVRPAGNARRWHTLRKHVLIIIQYEESR